MDKSEMNEKLEEGYVHCRAIIEMIGKPVEHIEGTLKQYVEKISKNENFEVINTDYAEPKEMEAGFSTFVEIEMLTKGTEHLTWFCFDYMPSSIEIMEPQSLKYDAKEFTNFLNDLQTRLHNVDMTVKKLNAINTRLNANTEALLKNTVKICIKGGKNSLNDISRLVGMDANAMKNFLDKFVADGVIVENDGAYDVPKQN